MSLYPLGICRSRDVPAVAEELRVGRFPVRWVLVDELAGALGDAPGGPPEPLRHAAALEAIHRRICVLPMRFRTVPCDEAEIRSLLETRHRDLLQRLEHLEGTCEMGLRIVLPECRTVQTDPSPGSSPPVSYLHQRRAHYHRQDSLGERARLTEERLVRQLQGTFRGWRRLARRPPGLVRLAFLVERERLGLFERCLEASGAERPEEQRTLLGPWPPYSFV